MDKVSSICREPMDGVNRYAKSLLLSLLSRKSEAVNVRRTTRVCCVSA